MSEVRLCMGALACSRRARTLNAVQYRGYRSASLISNNPLLGPYSRTMPRPYGGLREGSVFNERGKPALEVHGSLHHHLRCNESPLWEERWV